MTPFQKLQQAILKTEVVRSPKQSLATFGQTHIDYYLVSGLLHLPDRSRLRTGGLVAQKPKIIMPEDMAEQFEGFGREGKKFGDWLLNTYGHELRGLHYRFVNRLQESRLEHASPEELVNRINRGIGEDPAQRVTLLKGPDEGWELALLKLIIEMSSQSFRGNIVELEERGFFDPGTRVEHERRREIEKLFRKAAQDRSLLGPLAQKLREYRFFEQYQDRFFNLVQTR